VLRLSNCSHIRTASIQMNCSWQTWQLFEHKVDLCAARFSLVLFSYILHPSEKKMKKNLVCRALTFGACFSLALVFSVTQVNAQSGSRLAAPLAGSGTSQVIPQAIGSGTSQAIPQASSVGSGTSQSVISSAPAYSSPSYSSAPAQSYSSPAPTSSCCGGSAPTTTYYSAPAPAPVYSAPVYSAPVYSAPVYSAPVVSRPRWRGCGCGCR